MSFRLSALALGLTGLLGLAGCGGMYEEAAYPEAPPPAPRPISAEAEPQPEAAPPPPPESQELVVGGDNDDGTLYRETDPSALTEFRTTLDPYGSWVDDDTYGTVWVPSATVVGSDFTPYVTAGRWTYDDGYVWASDYDWGWAPFHYGRWVYIGGRGWSWIPGRVYRGAWVVWRTGPSGFGYVGWGPAPPLWYWRGGYAYGFSGGYRTPYYFCETRHVFHPQVGGRVVRGPMANDIGKRTEPYVPAEPRVDQGRVAATPRVGEGAGPSGVGATTGLRRGAAGPELASLGHETSKVPRPAPTDKGLARAYDLGAPKSAVALGARAPSVAPRPLGALAGTPSTTYQGPARVGGVGPVARDHAVAPTRLPPLRSEHSVSTSQQAPLPRMSESRPSSPPMVDHHRMPDISSSHSSPSFHPSPSYRSSAPSSPAPRAPSVSSPSVSRSPSSPSTFHSPSPSVSRPPSSPSVSGGGRAPSSAPRGSSTNRVRR